MPRAALRPTPFSKVLIANRGEIACRIIRSARALGLRTVAVYSTVDAGARHVRDADQALCIGDALPASSYLRIDALIGAARRSDADAVHPGYGFLAENAAFAAACRDAGLVFVGPSPEAIAAMGNKAEAKRRMAAAGLPCLPGYAGGDQDDARLAAEAARIGYPLMVKATAGGGGRGLRRVASADAFAAALAAARREAASAFGDATVLLERAVVAPRHVEVQVFADRHGQVIHLGERDCSVQRRHQKLIEETPSPAVDAALRERMGAAAVKAVQTIGVEGAGTLEFLLDEAGDFYFMEMNTRLQVEHPVTEAVTGLDLVALQLRVAAGDPLPVAQQDVRLHGHAIEVRLCAEDAQQAFLPQTGRLLRWQPPAGLRVEHALECGTEITPHYDSMLAKLVAHGPTRDEARRRLAAGLADLVALGVTTNQAFLARCLAHPVFAAGAATTAFVAEHADALAALPADTGASVAAVAALLLVLTRADPHASGVGHALAHRLPQPLRFVLDGRPVAATLTRQDSAGFRVDIDDDRWHLTATGDADAGWRVTLDGIDSPVVWARDGARLCMHWQGRPFEAVDLSLAAARQPGKADGDGQVRASMSGRVVALHAAAGAPVAAGQPLVTLEAMKMEHLHVSPVDGRIEALPVAPGDQVAAGQTLAKIVPLAAPN